MSDKLASVNISIPYKGPGNVISQHPVAFEVYSDEDQYKAVPQLDDEQRRVANLPEELLFTYSDGKPVSNRGIRDGNFHAIQDIVNELQKKKLI
jgi:hypothetical protein